MQDHAILLLAMLENMAGKRIVIAIYERKYIP
jgi:hypothetical protein